MVRAWFVFLRDDDTALRIIPKAEPEKKKPGQRHYTGRLDQWQGCSGHLTR
jgi:hypothetical protein